jgi:hypothetical protein
MIEFFLRGRLVEADMDPSLALRDFGKTYAATGGSDRLAA